MTELIENVDSVVRHVLGGTSLKDSMTLADVCGMICEVRHRIEKQHDGGSTSRTTGLYRFMLADLDSMATDGAEVDALCSGVFCLCL